MAPDASQITDVVPMVSVVGGDTIRVSLEGVVRPELRIGIDGFDIHDSVGHRSRASLSWHRTAWSRG